MSFSGQRILITGGAKGLGRTIVQKFHDEGAIVFAMDSDGEALAKLKLEIPGIHCIKVNITDWEATKIEMNKAGPFNHLINNAAVVRVKKFLDISEEDVDITLGVNFKAALHVSQVFVQGVIAGGITAASIVNISSLGDRKTLRGLLTYSCSKAALTMLTKCMAKELGVHGIRVNAVRPSTMKTTMFFDHVQDNDEEVDAKLLSYFGDAPIKGILKTSEVAELVHFLCSPAAAMITGEDVAIDGGLGIV